MNVTNPPRPSNGLRPDGRHAGHDELLIARFVGGDVSADERRRADALTETCEECRRLYRDLAGMAHATGMSLPPVRRRRDFQLSEADAARLRSPSLTERIGRMLGEPRRLLEPAAGALVVVGLLMATLTAPGVLPFASNEKGMQSEVAAPAAQPATGGGGSTFGAAVPGGLPARTSVASHAADLLAPAGTSAPRGPVAPAASPKAPVAAPSLSPATPVVATGSPTPFAAVAASPPASSTSGAGIMAPAPLTASVSPAEGITSSAVPSSAQIGVAAWQAWLGVALLGAIVFVAARFALRRRPG